MNEKNIMKQLENFTHPNNIILADWKTKSIMLTQRKD